MMIIMMICYVEHKLTIPSSVYGNASAPANRKEGFVLFLQYQKHPHKQRCNQARTEDQRNAFVVRQRGADPAGWAQAQ